MSTLRWVVAWKVGGGKECWLTSIKNNLLWVTYSVICNGIVDNTVNSFFVVTWLKAEVNAHTQSKKTIVTFMTITRKVG